MKKFFESKIALAVFIVIAFALILIFSHGVVVAGIYSLVLGAFAGFCYTNKYWKLKWDNTQKDIDEWKKNYKG